MKHHSIPDTHGRLRVLVSADPPAGVDPSITTDANVRLRFISAFATVIAAAVAATRTPMLVLPGGGARMARIPSLITYLSGETKTFYWIAGQPDRTAAVGGFCISGAPLDWYIQGGDLIEIITDQIQAADNWGTLQVYVEEWIEE